MREKEIVNMKNNLNSLDFLKHQAKDDLYNLKYERTKYPVIDIQKKSISSFSFRNDQKTKTSFNFNLKKPVKAIHKKPKITPKIGPWETEESSNKLLIQDWKFYEPFNVNKYMRFKSMNYCQCSDFFNSEDDLNSFSRVNLKQNTNLNEPSKLKNNNETNDENKLKNNMTKAKPLKQTVIENLPTTNKGLEYRIDKFISARSSEELYFLPKQKTSNQLNLKCSYLQLNADFESLTHLNTQPQSSFDKTLNDIKKTRQELIDEYKTMMQTQNSNGQQTPLHFRHIEPISFGHNVKFLRTNNITNLKRPRFEDTLQILMKNKTFYSDNKN